MKTDPDAMSNKCIPFVVPIILFMMASPVFSQPSLVSNAAVGEDENKSGTSWFTPSDTKTAIFSPESLIAHTFSGWYSQPGQMPVLIPTPLPNSMPILNPPPVDKKMIIPSAGRASDLLRNPHQRK